jgi:hypothetical protein
MNLGIEKFIEELNKINGKHVKIDIVHKLYGNQVIEYDLCILNDKGRLGFCINEQEIYINKGCILGCGINKGMYFWADKIMTIKIQTT